MSSITISTEKLHALFLDCKQKVCTDTRKIEQGSIFFSLKGANFNANEFAAKAIEQGCRYAVVDEQKYANGQNIFLVEATLVALQELAKFHRHTFNIPVIGITGSNGKTTNKELIHAVLSKKYRAYATKGNLNNHIGVPLTLLSVTGEHDIAIIEMGANHQGEIDFLCGIAQPNYGLITNIGKAHLEGFGGEEGVKKGKSELYKYIRSHAGKIFVNGNDQTLLSLSVENDKIIYGIGNSNFDVVGKSFEESEFVEMAWCLKAENIDTAERIKTHMFGHYNFINLLCAACIGHYFGVDKQLVNEALSDYVPEMNRSQVVKTKNNTVILDAYNANPTSMKAAIENFAEQKNQHKVLFLGDMLELGNYSASEHLFILELLKNKGFEAVFLVGPLFYDCRERYPQYRYFKNTEESEDFVKHNPLLNFIILVKGSRGIKLEKMLDLL